MILSAIISQYFTLSRISFQRLSPDRPAIFHTIAVDAVLGFRRTFGSIKTVPPCYVQVSEFDVPSADCGGTSKNRYSNCQTEGGGGTPNLSLCRLAEASTAVASTALKARTQP